jgi:hypothetical protein
MLMTKGGQGNSFYLEMSRDSDKDQLIKVMKEEIKTHKNKKSGFQLCKALQSKKKINR